MNTLPDIKTHFAEWYQDVIIKAELVDSSPTRGCFVIRPYGYAIWEGIQQTLDKKIKDMGVANAYFPLLIPQSFLQKEEKHIEGFSPELAVVTHGGGNQLEEPLVVRPTSETMIYHMFSKWITSWRDLPLSINQWANVVRWEMRTRPFVRSLEFLWQEGHTAHRSYDEAKEMALAALQMYKDIYENYLAIAVVAGEKTPQERFAGADTTYTIEGLMQDGKALQMCTSHLLSPSFPASFDVAYQDADGSMKTPYCTSWGFTTRSIGALIMSHGDQAGLIMPPKVAPIQVVIVPIFKNDDEKSVVLAKAHDIKSLLVSRSVRVHIDATETTTPGAKFFYWEMRGVPIRLEIGPKDITNQQAVLVNRIETEKAKKKIFVPLQSLADSVDNMLAAIHQALFERSRQRMLEQWHQADKITTFGQQMDTQQGLYQTGWCGSAECEAVVKQYKGTVRCLLQEKKHATCFACDAASVNDILVAKAY